MPDDERDATTLPAAGAGLGTPQTATPQTATPRPARGGLAGQAAFYSFATGLGRVAGLVREVVAASYFGVSAAMSAFTVAFQVPNLIRAMVAEAALQGAFVPVFTELLEKGKRKEAFRAASSLFFLICLALGGLTALFILIAPIVMPVFVPGFADQPALEDLTVNLARLLFPIVLLLTLSGLVIGILTSFEHFTVPAITPIAWNLLAVAAVFALTPLLPEEDEIYAYAIGMLAGSVAQLVLPMPWLRGRGGRLSLAFDWRNEHVVQVLKLMLPVTLTLGLVNFSLLINSFFGTLVSEEAPAAIDKAFRIYQLPHGIFAVAIGTILFPRMNRFAARGAFDDLRRTTANGVRQLCLLLIASAAILVVLAEPITRLLFERGAFGAEATDLVAEATLWWALSLPFQGVSLMYSRAFFSLQRPWATTALAGANLAVNAVVALALYAPLGLAGVVLGTVAGTVAMTVGQGIILRRAIGGVEGRETLAASARMLVAAAGLAAATYGAWAGVDRALGRSLLEQGIAVGVGIAAGLVAYGAAVWALRLPEGRQIRDLVATRLRRPRPSP